MSCVLCPVVNFMSFALSVWLWLLQDLDRFGFLHAVGCYNPLLLSREECKAIMEASG